jgi:ABC-type hemin transport system substrate-binding protein
VNDINLALAMNKTEPVYGLGVSETVVGLKSTSSTSKHSDGTNIVNLGYLNKF